MSYPSDAADSAGTPPTDPQPGDIQPPSPYEQAAPYVSSAPPQPSYEQQPYEQGLYGQAQAPDAQAPQAPSSQAQQPYGEAAYGDQQAYGQQQYSPPAPQSTVFGSSMPQPQQAYPQAPGQYDQSAAQYGGPQQAYPQAPGQYDQSAAQYGGPQQAYPQAPGQYDQSAAQYGGPQQAYPQAPGQYDQSPAQYGGPQQQYGQVPGQYGGQVATGVLEVPGEQPPAPPPGDGPKVASLTPPGPVRVDLLPSIYHERLVLAKARSRALIIVFTAFALVVLLYLLGMMQVGGAQADLDNASAAKAQAQNQVNDLAVVPQTMAEIETITNALESALGSEVLMSQFLANVTNSLPAGTTLTSVNVTLTIPPVPSPDGLTQDVGDLSLEGTLPSFVSNAALIDSVKANPQLANVWVPTTSLTEEAAGGGRYTFSLTADLTEQALSKRFTAEQLAEAAANANAGVNPTSSATPEPGVTP